MKAYRALVLATLALTFVVVVAGAYVRLADAGLGCPDWPLCYGEPTPGSAAHDVAKAWKEMAHRYLVAILGVLIAAVAISSWMSRRSPWLAMALVAVMIFQAALGKWTVTMLLKPAIVTAHLLGGMALLALVAWLALEQWAFPASEESRRLRLPALLALLVLVVQIALGGWVSANYAALACPDLPGCLGAALPAMDFGNAFHVVRELGRSADGELLPREALTAIHWTHRVFALVVLALIGAACWRAYRSPLRSLAALVALLLIVQFALGVMNVAFALPLALAAAHNAGAALLLVSLVVLNFFSFRGLYPHW